MMIYNEIQSDEYFPVGSRVIVYVPPYTNAVDLCTASLSYWIVPGTAGED